MKEGEYDFRTSNPGLCGSISVGIFKWVKAASFEGTRPSAAFFRIKFQRKDFHKINTVCEKVCQALNEGKLLPDLPYIVSYRMLTKYGFDG